MFSGITLFTLIFTSILSYYNQTKIYTKQREENIQFVASYLEELPVSEDIYFVWYQDYFLQEAGSLLIPSNFDDTSVQDARIKYEEIISEEYPGLVLGADITFDYLSKRAKTAYQVYTHEYFLAAFEKALKLFNISFIYYIVPSDDDSGKVTYVIDAAREEKTVAGQKYLDFGITVTYPQKGHEHLWETWKSGKKISGHDIFHSEYRKNNVYFTPVFVGDRKMGLIEVEDDVAPVTREILNATLRQILAIGAALIFFMTHLLFIIRRRYIKKLVTLSDTIEEYSKNKNPELSKKALTEATNEDEISTIMKDFSEMVLKLEEYINDLTTAKQRLQVTQQKSLEISNLAMKDPLTGIRNKSGYDKEVSKIQMEMEKGLKDLGVAVIDLNYLKKINENYGHDKCNIAITYLSNIACHVFEHSPVFRIGGDEFVVILKNQDLENIDFFIEDFNGQLQKLQDNPDLEYREKTSAAIGYAIYDSEIDNGFEDIFRRADSEMYKNKKSNESGTGVRLFC